MARFSASSKLDDYLVPELNAAMIDLEEEGFIPWFLWQEQNLVTVIDTSTIALPATFSREMLTDSEEVDGTPMRIYDPSISAWKDLLRLDKHPLYSGILPISAQDQGIPTGYYVDLQEEQIVLSRYPDAAYFLRFGFIREGDRYSTSPADTDEPLWAKYAPNYLIATAGIRLANMYIKNAEAGQWFAADAQRGRTKLIHRHTTTVEAKINPNTSN
jgi:hypothetical protein